MKHMALDTHAEFCVLSVRDARLNEMDIKRIPTQAPALIEAVKVYRGPKTLVVEESNLASWFKQVLEPHVSRFMVCNPKKNRSVSEAEDKDDVVDARELSYLLGMNYLEEVHHPSEPRQRFKDLVLHYHRLTTGTARCKIQINAKLREQGIRLQSYNIEDLQEDLHPLKKLELQDLHELLDVARKVKANVHARLEKEARKHVQIQRFVEVPGIGIHHASTFYAIVDTPFRFKRRAKLWTYCGLGLKTRGSGGRVYRQKRGQEFNRYLKSAMMRAALVAIRRKDDNTYKRRYSRLLDRGADRRDAQTVIARSIATTMWGMWRSGERFNPDI